MLCHTFGSQALRPELFPDRVKMVNLRATQSMNVLGQRLHLRRVERSRCLVLPEQPMGKVCQQSTRIDHRSRVLANASAKAGEGPFGKSRTVNRRREEQQVQCSKGLEEALVIAKVCPKCVGAELHIVNVDKRNTRRILIAQKLRESIGKVAGRNRSVRTEKAGGQCFGIDPALIVKIGKPLLLGYEILTIFVFQNEVECQ